MANKLRRSPASSPTKARSAAAGGGGGAGKAAYAAAPSGPMVELARRLIGLSIEVPRTLSADSDKSASCRSGCSCGLHVVSCLPSPGLASQATLSPTDRADSGYQLVPNVVDTPREPQLSATPAINFESLQYVRRLGYGMFADVRLFENPAPEGPRHVAVKMLRSSAREQLVPVQDFMHEILLLRNLPQTCPSIVAYYGDGICIDASRRSARFLALEAGVCSLAKRLQTGAALHPQQILLWAVDIASALAFLHAQRPAMIIHRDVKPENVVIGQDGRAKLTDFGLAKRVLPAKGAALGDDAWNGRLSGEVGSYRYMAPEVLRGQEYGAPVDVFSFGILLYEMLAQEQAYIECFLPPRQVACAAATMGLRPELNPHWPESTRSLLEACWAADPARRPTMPAVIERLNDMLREAL